MKSILWLMLMGTLAVAQIPPAVRVAPTSPANLAPGEAARIEGRVYDSKGQPIAGVAVRLEPVPVPLGTTSGEDGTFTIDDVPPGSGYRLLVQRQGYARAIYGAGRANNYSGVLIALARGQVLKDIVIEMHEQAVIAGTVTDAYGDPRPNVNVAVMRRGYQAGVPRLQSITTAGTDDLGGFRVSNLVPGTYFVRVSESIVEAGGGAEARLPTYYPNAAEERDARAILLGDGEEARGINVRMRPGRIYAISGKLVGIDGKPVSDISLVALPTGGTLPSTISAGTSGPDGSFRLLGVAPGAWVVQNNPTATTYAWHPVAVVDHDLTDVVVRAIPGRTISGSMRAEGGDLQELLAGAKPRVSLVPSGPLNRPCNAVAKEDGTFEIIGIPPEAFNIDVSDLPENVYVKSQELTDTSLEIVLSPKAAAIVGVAAEAHTLVTLWMGDKLLTSLADQNRAFDFQHLAPGVYYLAAWEDADPGLVANAEFRAKFTDKAMRLEIAEGAREAIEPPLIPAAAYLAEEAKIVH